MPPPIGLLTVSRRKFPDPRSPAFKLPCMPTLPVDVAVNTRPAGVMSTTSPRSESRKISCVVVGFVTEIGPLVFHRLLRTLQDGDAEIVEIDGVTPSPRALLTADKCPPQTRAGHLWKVPIDGGEPLRLTDYIASRPSVSPDGKMIACLGRNESKRELLIIPFEGGQPLKRIDFYRRQLWRVSDTVDARRQGFDLRG